GTDQIGSSRSRVNLVHLQIDSSNPKEILEGPKIAKMDGYEATIEIRKNRNQEPVRAIIPIWH
ncbi:hypothetical protein CUMW_151560, partial [Citrus unshiu]